MLYKYCRLLIILSCFNQYVFSQSNTTYTWFNPLQSNYAVVNGRFWQTGLQQPYDRLPASAEKNIRKEVWDLSHNSAGEYISFTTNSNDIWVKFQVDSKYISSNLTAISMSGVDLYVQDKKGNWHWMFGQNSFNDTISFHFRNITSAMPLTEYRLYLPLYKTPTWINIGIPSNKKIEFTKINQYKPIVIYGTSILQGASASRPGTAWSSMVGRDLNMPVINLGFSGNGQLEPALLNLINEIDAFVFILDCMPNLHDSNKFSDAEVEKRIIDAVNNLQHQHAQTPIILTEHASGVPDINLDSSFTNKYSRVNKILEVTFNKMKNAGTQNIYLLSAKDIGFTYESTIDGTHPNDIGMMQYANAYEKLIKEILKLN